VTGLSLSPSSKSKPIQETNVSLRYKYDVALSFAGEQRTFVDRVYRYLKGVGLKVFYDEDPVVQARHIGERFSEISQMVYGSGAANVIMFISKEYVEKQWPVLESTHIADRLREALFRRDSGVLLADFDRSPVPGLASEIWRAKVDAADPIKFCEFYMMWRSEHQKLDHDDIILMLGRSLHRQAIGVLAKLDLNTASHNDKVFALYNISCARSKLARHEPAERETLLEAAIGSLEKCIEIVEAARPAHLQDLLDFANEDDDLIYLRREKSIAMKHLLRRGRLNLKHSGKDHSKPRACVDPTSKVSTPSGPVMISELKIGDEVFCFSRTHYETRVGKITACTTFPSKERLLINDALIVSREQSVFHQEKSWIESGELRVGDAIMGAEGDFIDIESLVPLNRGDVMIISI
jgi:TIR domain-containing protein